MGLGALMEVTGAKGLMGKTQAGGARPQNLRLGWDYLGVWYPHIGLCKPV